MSRPKESVMRRLFRLLRCKLRDPDPALDVALRRASARVRRKNGPAAAPVTVPAGR